jgi:hypothetical protein
MKQDMPEIKVEPDVYHTKIKSELSCKPRQMSLDFIAPGSTIQSIELSKDLMKKPSLLPSPILAIYSPRNEDGEKPTLPRIAEMGRPSSIKRHRSSPYPKATYYSPPPSSPSAGSTSSRSRSSSPPSVFSTRSERHEYDLEEKFALLYLRIAADGIVWRDVKTAFDCIFPPGQRRRTSVPASEDAKSRPLPPTYPRRSVGGLECRYYRVRENHGVPKVRDCKRDRDSPRIKAALVKMEDELVEGWYKSLDYDRQKELDVYQQPSQSAEDWAKRVREAYRAHSRFWKLLRIHSVFQH